MRTLAACSIFALALSACTAGDDDDDDNNNDVRHADAARAADDCNPAADNCAGETICVGGDCVQAFGRTYRISLALEVSTTTPDGDTWDALGGAPDPFIKVYLNGGLVMTTNEPQDTFEPQFSTTKDIVIPANAAFVADAYDADLSDHDWIMSCEADPLTADLLRYGSGTCEYAGSTLTIWFYRG